MGDGIHNAPIVLDNGSGTIRAGFAGEDLPKCYFPSYVGRPKHLRVLAGALEGDVFIGSRAQELRGLLKIRYPLEHGIVTDWDDMERIWQHVYTEELKTLSEEHPVLLTEAPLNPRSNRDTAAQILFETFNVPALFTSIQAVLSLYASGRTTGIVMDAGDGVSHAVPVYEGFAVPSSIKRVDVAGRDVTEYMQLLLRKSGYVFHTSAEKEVVRMIKEKTGYVAEDARREEKEWASSAGRQESKAVEYVLPDGNRMKVCCTERRVRGGSGANGRRLARRGSGRLRFCSIRSSLGSSIQASHRWLQSRYRGRIWIYERRCTPTWCCRVARH